MGDIHPGPGIWSLWGIGLSSLRLPVLSFFFTREQVYTVQSQGRTLVTFSLLTFFISFSGIFLTPATAVDVAVNTF